MRYAYPTPSPTSASAPSPSPRKPRRSVRWRLAAGALVGVLLLAGCGGGSTAAVGDAARIDPELVASLSTDEARTVAEAVDAFGFDLLGQLADGTGNVVISPVSVAALLAMVLAGADGDTADQLAEVLHLAEHRDPRLGGLLGQLADTEDVSLTVANSLWAAPSVELERDYLDYVQDTFGATVREADLGTPEIVEEVDGWVSDRTGGRIDEFAEALGLPNPAAVLVLLNAVHFLGTWTYQFDPDLTRDAPFTLPGGSQVTVPMMHQDKPELMYEVAARSDYRMLRLPYGEDGRYGMEVLLPEHGTTLATVLAGLDAAEWRTAVDSLQETRLGQVTLPRFTLDWQAELPEVLTALGVVDAFDPATADFRRMSPTHLWLDAVVHQTYLRVDEQGTEAAAVTGGVMLESAPPDFRVDQPFAFTISDRHTGTILFLGSVTDPTRGA